MVSAPRSLGPIFPPEIARSKGHNLAECGGLRDERLLRARGPRPGRAAARAWAHGLMGSRCRTLSLSLSVSLLLFRYKCNVCFSRCVQGHAHLLRLRTPVASARALGAAPGHLRLPSREARKPENPIHHTPETWRSLNRENKGSVAL